MPVAARDDQVIGAGTEAEHQEEPPQEEEYVDEEQNQDQELTDFYNTQGKPRCMKTPYHLQSSLTIITVLMHLSL